MKVVAFLPVKGNSERFENKNIRLLDGKPLFLHALDKLLACEVIDEVYLDSDSDVILDMAQDRNCKLMKRDKSLASNKTDGHELFFNEVKQVNADIYIQMLCTSPFISDETITNGVKVLKENDCYDSAVLVRCEKQYIWQNGQPAYLTEKGRIPNSVDLPESVIETMGLYMIKKEAAHLKQRVGEKPYLLKALPIEAIDVNYTQDFDLANYIAAGIRESERSLFKNLSSKLTSAMLSDILDDLGIEHSTITELTLNLPCKKLLGRAKTLKLRPLNPGEAYQGIYDALKSYETIITNDIIVVENACPEYAYFGEMNANLAIRSGAVGAIIGGKTRDSKDVADLDFPVFSMGYKCKDVRKRATMESFNKPISLFGVTVFVDDLIFADNDGIVVIPKQYEKQVLSMAFETISTERKIVFEIANMATTDQIIEKCGFF